MPTQKLKSKIRVGSKEMKVYDEPRSPFRRLLECARLPREHEDSLQAAGRAHIKKAQVPINRAMEREAERIAPLTAYLSVLRDPRVERNKLYLLEEVIIITIPAVIAPAQGWEDIERYAKAKKDRLGRFLKLEHGIPPHDVYRRVMSRLKPEEVERCFMDWVRAIRKGYDREIVAIDGKTVRGHFKPAEGGKALHVVSAWARQ